MPISPIALQRRHAELGRIRLGDKGDRGQPQKLTRFRFTSPHERHITDLAHLYGGDARPWRNGTRDEWEVYSTATSIPVVVVRGGISQWMETWSGGGCVHRCDGFHEVLTDTECDPDDPKHQGAKPTTRLSVMVRDLGAIGVWRMESHGWNAAAELPGLVELAQHVADLVPARLHLAERVSVKDGRTSKFVVPGLDLEVTPARLTAIMGGHQQDPPQPAAVEAGPDRPALESARVERLDVAALAAGCDSREDLLALRQRIVDAGPDAVGMSWDDVERTLRQRAEQLTPPAGETAPPEPAAVAPGGPVDEDAAWMRCLSEGGRLGLDLPGVKDAYSRWTEGELVDDADGKRLVEFAEHLAKQQAAA